MNTYCKGYASVERLNPYVRPAFNLIVGVYVVFTVGDNVILGVDVGYLQDSV